MESSGRVVEIQQLARKDWERWRSIRLRALRDAPDAFATRIEDVEARPSAWWRARFAGSDVANFVAVLEERDVGLVTGGPFEGRDQVAGLFAMWVAPHARGAGVSDRLVAAVINWARLAEFQRLVLEVADENLAAVRLYERMGFIATGALGSLPPPRQHIREHERELML